MRGSVSPVARALHGVAWQAGHRSARAQDAVPEFANGIGPEKEAIEANPVVVKWAHDRGLLVHPYTFRAEFVSRKYGDIEGELHQYYFGYDVDGAFTDFPDRALAVLSHGTGG